MIEEPPGKFQPALIKYMLKILHMGMVAGSQLCQPGDLFLGKAATQCNRASVQMSCMLVW